MYRSSVTLASSGYLKEFRRKISRGDAKQEMTPLASHEEVPGTTPDYGGTAETPSSGDAGADANASCDPEAQKDNQGDAEAADTTDARFKGRSRPLRPTLKILASTQSPTLGSPDSDTDVLDFLDYTPEALSDACDGRGSNAYSTVYQTSKYTELMPGAFIPRLPIRLRIARVQPVHSHIHIFNNHV